MQFIASLSDAHGPSVALSSLACHLDTLYSGALDGSLCVWHLSSESGPSVPGSCFTQTIRMENVHPLGIVTLLAGPNGTYLASHSIEASQLLLHQTPLEWTKGTGSGQQAELANRMERVTVPISPIHAYCLALCKETDEIWMGGLGPILEIMTQPAGSSSSELNKRTLELPAHPTAPLIQHITCLAVTDSLVALSTESHAILLYDRKHEKWLSVALHEHTKPIRSLAFQTVQKTGCYHLWSSGDDGRVHLYELLPMSSGEAAWQAKYRLGWNAHADWVTRMLLLEGEATADDKRQPGLLVTASSSGQLKVWPLPSLPLGSTLVAPEPAALYDDVAGDGPIWALCQGPGKYSVCIARGTCLSLYQQQ